MGFPVIAAGFFIFVGKHLMILRFRGLDIQLTRVFPGLSIEFRKQDQTEIKFSVFLLKRLHLQYQVCEY